MTLPAFKKKAIWAVAVFVAVIVIDQIIKIIVKTNLWLGEDVELCSFAHIRFVENNGMAFGMEMGSKLILTIFRFLAVGVLIWLLWRVIKRQRYPLGFVITLALITAGAAGNLIDCLFYGEIFNNPYPPQVAQFVPWGDGYASFGHGRVVDMFYFPLFSFTWPDWFPFVGGKVFSFFDPVFNFADAAVSVGMLILIIFYNKYFGKQTDKKRIESDNADSVN